MKDLHLLKQEPQWVLVPTVVSFLPKPAGVCVCSKEPEARCLHFIVFPAHLPFFPQEIPCQCFQCPRHTARFFLKEMLDWSSRILAFMLPVPSVLELCSRKFCVVFFFVFRWEEKKTKTKPFLFRGAFRQVLLILPSKFYCFAK